jgi:DNA-binding MarR family transcriptional regulator
MADSEDVEGLDLIGGIMDLVKASMSAALKRDGERLLLMEAHVLRIVLAREDCTQLDVVREARRDKAQIGKLIRSLVGRGLLVQSPDLADARRQRLTLTPDGEAIARKSGQHRAAIAQQLFQDMPTAERDALIATLRALEGRLERDVAPTS